MPRPVTRDCPPTDRIPASFTELVEMCWPIDKALAEDLGIGHDHARKFRPSNFIPDYLYSAVVAAARKRGFRQVTHRLMCDLAEKRPAQ